MIGKNSMRKFQKIFLNSMQKALSKIPYGYRKILKKTEKFKRLLIGRKFYDINNQVCSNFFHMEMIYVFIEECNLRW